MKTIVIFSVVSMLLVSAYPDSSQAAESSGELHKRVKLASFDA